MVLFDKAYQCWDEFSPFAKRELITEKDLVDWADRINLSKNRSKDYFRAFVQILILAEELIPLEIGIDKLKSKLDIMKFHKGPSPALDKESIEILIFHPIQFIDVIFWSNHLFDYIPLLDKVRSLHDYILLKIKKKNLELSIENLKGHRMDTTGREAKLQEINLKIDNHNSNIEKNKIPLGNELIKFLGINRARTLFNEEKIISWIKIETLILDFYPNIYSTKSFNIILKIKEKNSFDQKIQDETREEYVNWVQESYNNINTIFTDSDINTLKDLSKKIDSFLIFRDFHNYEEWMDLFDLISVNKKNELKGQISFYLNLMSVKRYIDRFLYEYFTRIDPNTERPFYIVKNFDNYKDYLQKTLGNFNLLSSNPFVLVVEGATEYNLLGFFRTHFFDYPFEIENLHGDNEIDFLLRINNTFSEKDIWFLRDYDRKDKYNTKVKNERTIYFFPDFITENFSESTIFDQVLDFLYDQELSLTKSEKEDLFKALTKAKAFSKDILNSIENNAELPNYDTDGYEKVIINFLKTKYPKEMVNAFPEFLSLDSNDKIKEKVMFNNLIKKEITSRLHGVLKFEFERESLFELFPFEIKLKPFFDKILTHFS